MVARNLSPVSTTNAKVLPITGTHQNVASSLAIGVYSGSAEFVSGAVDQVAYVFNKLGGNILDIELQEKIKLADIALREAAGLEEGSNLNSTNQLVKIIYSFEKNDEGEWVQVDDFGMGLYPFEFTKKGAPSTNEETLTKVKAMVEEEFAARGLKSEQ